jgi:hypothetical protein
MIHEFRETINHPTDNGRWVEIDYTADIVNYDERDNSATAYLESFTIIDQSLKEEDLSDGWDDTSWVTWELVKAETKTE